MTKLTMEDAARRARAMEALPEPERDVLVAVGVARGEVIDARCRFDPDRLLPTLEDLFANAVTTVIFEGVFGPEDAA